MMKKLLLLSSALFAFHFGAEAQGGVSTPTVVTDTLNYFINKQQFKIGTVMQQIAPTFSYFKAATGNAVNSHQFVEHCGSIFKNKDTSLMVTGLEGYAAKHNKSVSATVAIKLYLCNVVGGLPVLPAIDSVGGFVNNGYDPVTLFCPPQKVSGDFATPRRVRGDFAVLIRNYSSVSGDTVRLFRTSTLVPGTNILTGAGSEYYKTGEGLGVVRKLGAFHLTANYTGDSGFGYGTDYEFCVAPRVTFTLQVSQIRPDKADNACMFDSIPFVNTSSPEFTNKQFNLNEFYRQNKPFQTQPGPPGIGFAPDTVMLWNFDDDHRLDTVPYLWGRVQDIYLGVNQDRILKNFDTAGVFLNGYQLAKYRKMTTCYSNRLAGRETFSTSVSACGEVGIRELNNLNGVNVYPNPAVNGKVNITGLQGKNTIVVFNMLGQTVSSETTEKQSTVLDLLKQPAGSYTIRIVNTDGSTKALKLINRND
jgi:hypothetical protein